MKELKKENKVLKKILNNNSKNNNIKVDVSSKIKMNQSFDLLEIKKKYSWSDSYYKSNKKLYEQMHNYFIQEYPAIKNANFPLKKPM
jgi:hypothetical protein